MKLKRELSVYAQKEMNSSQLHKNKQWATMGRNCVSNHGKEQTNYKECYC
jgi:hypothetical protein